MAIFGALLVLGGLGYFAYNALKPKSATVMVTLNLYNGTDGCDVGVGYFDVPGSAVTLESDGVPVAVGALDQFGEFDGYACVFKASLPNVPTGGSIYSLTVGGGNRGTLTSSKEELQSAGWQWSLTLGN